MSPETSGVAAGGFSFDLCRRNGMLGSRGVQGPGFTKTGTTIAGIIYKVNGAPGIQNFSCAEAFFPFDGGLFP